MVSSNSNGSQPASTAGEGKTGQTQGAVLDPHSPIEVASQGTGPVNDPAGTDTKPPGITGLDLLA